MESIASHQSKDSEKAETSRKSKSDKSKKESKNDSKKAFKKDAKDSSSKVAWSNAQFHQCKALMDLKKVIILDTGSTIGATFANPDLVAHLQAALEPLRMATKAGSKVLTLQGEVVGFEGEVWYDPSFVANIFGFAHLVDSDDTRLTYDTKKEDAFIVHSRSRQVKFTKTPEGLYPTSHPRPTSNNSTS